MKNKIFRMAFPLASGWATATTVRIRRRILLGALLALALSLLIAMQPANATLIEWTVSGDVGPLLTGTDIEALVDATITLRITVDDTGVYEELFGVFPFAPIESGDITISGSGIAANNATHSLTFPFAFQIPPYGFSPKTFATNVHDQLTFFPAITLPTGKIMTLAHAIESTPSGAAASLGSNISIDDFPVGSPQFPNFTVAIHPNATDSVISQYGSTTPTFAVSEVSNGAPIPEPATMLLLGSGLIGLAGFRRKFRK